MSFHYYRLYGLRIASEFELPTDPEVRFDDDERADYCISIAVSAGKPPPLQTTVYRCAERGRDGEPAFVICRDGATRTTHWRWCDGVTINIDGPRIDVYCPPQEALSGVAHTIVGSILAYLMRDRGHSLLHGSALTGKQTAFAILGPSGAGKSTLATALSLRGYRLLTDDVVALTVADGIWHALAGYGGLRLWPDSAEALLGESEAAAVPPMLARTAYWLGFDKRFMRLRAESGARATGPALLRHIFVLQNREATGPVFERLTGPAAVAALDRNAYQLMLRGAEHGRRDLAVFAALARQAAIWSVVPSDDLSAIDALAAGVEERLREQ